MKKTNCFYFLVMVIIFMIFSTSVLAVKGCFLDEESELFCEELTKISAEQECYNQEDCNIEKDYAYGQNCDDFEACEIILCKSTCQEEFRGKCSYGEVPENEEQQWCSEGCCKFSYFGEEFCEVTENLWVCQIEANNKDVNQIDWDINTNSLECIKCSEALNLEIFVLEEINLEELNSVELEMVSLNEEAEQEELVSNSVVGANKESEDIKKSFFLIFLTVSIIFLLHFGKNFHLKNSKKKKEIEKFNYKLPDDKEWELEDIKRRWSDFLNNSSTRLKSSIKKRKIKQKGFHLDESFGNFSKKKQVRTNLEKLNSSVKNHNRKKFKIRKLEIKNSFNKIKNFHLDKILFRNVGKYKKGRGPGKLNVIKRKSSVEELKQIISKNK